MQMRRLVFTASARKGLKNLPHDLNQEALLLLRLLASVPAEIRRPAKDEDISAYDLPSTSRILTKKLPKGRMVFVYFNCKNDSEISVYQIESGQDPDGKD